MVTSQAFSVQFAGTPLMNKLIKNFQSYDIQHSGALKSLQKLQNILYILFNFSILISAACGDRICEEGIKFPVSNAGLHKYLNSSYLQQFDEIIVIGDVHGCYDELMTLLTEANVLGDNVLKIFAGDLVRKGPKNREVLNMITASNSMISVRGNHDEATLQEYYDFNPSNTSNDSCNRNEDWIGHLSTENVQFLTELPYTITLLPLNIIIVHAGLEPGTRVEENDPYYLMNLRDIVYDEQENCLRLTTEDGVGQSWSVFWRGPQHIVFGHDSRKLLQIRDYATGIDTGCVFGNYLTGYFISGPRTGYLHTTDCPTQYCTHKN